MRRFASLQRFVHVGTAYICGTPAPRYAQDMYPRLNARHVVEYVEQGRGEICSVPRCYPSLSPPSVVVGHDWGVHLLPASTGTIAAQLLRCIPAGLQFRKDIIPVDYAASAWRTYCFGAPDTGTMSLRESGAA